MRPSRRSAQRTEAVPVRPTTTPAARLATSAASASGEARAERDAERGEDGVARARHVEDLAGARGDPERLAPLRQEEHPLLRELHEDRVEAELVAQARGEARDRAEVAGALARHRLELLAVRRDARGAAVAGVVLPLRVDERGDSATARLAEERLHDARRERPLRVVGEEEDVGRLERREARGDELLLGRGREDGGELLVDAEELAAVGDHPPLDGRRPERVDDDAPPRRPGSAPRWRREPRPFLLRARRLRARPSARRAPRGSRRRSRRRRRGGTSTRAPGAGPAPPARRARPRRTRSRRASGRPRRPPSRSAPRPRGRPARAASSPAPRRVIGDPPAPGRAPAPGAAGGSRGGR